MYCVPSPTVYTDSIVCTYSNLTYITVSEDASMRVEFEKVHQSDHDDLVKVRIVDAVKLSITSQSLDSWDR